MARRMNAGTGLRLVILVAVVTLGVNLSELCADDLWRVDFSEAKEVAKRQEKDLLLDFTGSDWCGWCQRLDEEVFSTAFFRQEAPKDFVLVKLDFPRRKEQEEWIKEQNAKLSTHYRISGYPTILLADAKGRPYARTGYRKGGAEAYIQHLQQLQERKAAVAPLWEEAEEASGLERARLLDRIAGKLKNFGVSPPTAIFEEIVELDAGNDAGLRKLYRSKLAMIEFNESMRGIRDPQKAIQMLDKQLERDVYGGEEKLMLRMTKAGALVHQNKLDSALDTLEEAKGLAPESQAADQLPELIKQIKEMQKMKKE